MRLFVFLFALCTMYPCRSTAQTDDRPKSEASSFPNLRVPTLGGTQFWTDHVWREGWRVQQNALTGHWRLIDDQNIRQAWGGKDACVNVLNDKVNPRETGDRRIVVLVHGLGRAASSMSGLAEFIQGDNPCTVVQFEYASTRAPVADHARALRSVVDSLPSECPLSFVGHSLGNIVVRHALGDWEAQGNHDTLNRVDRIVMLGPPNQGSALARLMSKTPLFTFVAGKSSQELGPEWEQFRSKLATPKCPFGIVAGSTKRSHFKNPLLKSDNDLLVSIEETKLQGAADFLIVDELHTFLMDNETVQRAIVHFLADAKFE